MRGEGESGKREERRKRRNSGKHATVKMETSDGGEEEREIWGNEEIEVSEIVKCKDREGEKREVGGKMIEMIWGSSLSREEYRGRDGRGIERRTAADRGRDRGGEREKFRELTTRRYMPGLIFLNQKRAKDGKI